MPNAKEPAWFTQLSACLEGAAARPSHRWVQLATVRGPSSADLEGRPAVRTVSIRNATPERMHCVSDMRSGKVDDVLRGASQYAEVCWVFPESNMQFRLSGKLIPENDGEARDAQWEKLPATQRVWWSWPTPGAPRAPAAEFESPPLVSAPEQFCICVLLVDAVEILNLSDCPFPRERFYLQIDSAKPENRTWARQPINP